MASVKSLTQKSMTLNKYPVGGYGALIQRPNVKPERVKETPTLFIPQPASSSLPYLSDDVKMKSNESILKLSIANAKRNENHKAVTIYTDKDRELIDDKISEKLYIRDKFKEPRTEDLLRNYLKGEINKRNTEKINDQNKKMTGVDENIKKLNEENESRKQKLLILAEENKIKQEENNMKFLNETIQKHRAAGGLGMQGVNTDELIRRVNEGDTRISKLLTHPQIIQGQPKNVTYQSMRPIDLFKRATGLEKSELRKVLEEEYTRAYNSNFDNYSSLNKTELNNKIKDLGLDLMLPSKASKADKIDLLTNHDLILNPASRELGRALGVQDVFFRQTKPVSQTLVDIVPTIENKKPIQLPEPMFRGILEPKS